MGNLARTIAAALVCGALTIVLAGCLGLPMPVKLGSKRQGLPWRDRALGIRSGARAELRFRSRDDVRGTVRLFKESEAGRERSVLEFRPASGVPHRVADCWYGRLVDATEIRWPSGEIWFLFAWDYGNATWFRTLTVFEPSSLALFSCELEFARNARKELTGSVIERYTWNPGDSRSAVFHRFLAAIKEGYADPDTWGQTTRGTRLFRQGTVASVTFRPRKERPLQDALLFDH